MSDCDHHKGLLHYLHLAFNDRVTTDVGVSLSLCLCHTVSHSIAVTQQVRVYEGMNYTVTQSETRKSIYLYCVVVDCVTLCPYQLINYCKKFSANCVPQSKRIRAP